MQKYRLNKFTVLVLSIISQFFFHGCSGDLYMVKHDNAKALESITNDEGAIKGKNGDIIATADNADPSKACTPQLQYKRVVMPDYDKPYQVYYHHGFLEYNKFGVELKEGVLTSVNTSSEPDRGQTFKNLGEAATSFAGVLEAQPIIGKACMSTPVLDKVYRYPNIEDFPSQQ